MRSTRKKYRAFTLIEILVVMGIISVLLSLLLPCLSAAKERARQAVCMNNLRNIWTGILSYSMVYDDRAPFMEEINLNDPNADPFDPDSPTTVGTLLSTYVTPGNWRCPSAITGYPRSAGAGQWTMTYSFNSAGPVGKGIPFDDNPDRFTGFATDPVLSNYVQFDGRFLKLLDGRRYIGSASASANFSKKYNRWWHVRWPLINDTFIKNEQPAFFSPRYPHKAALQGRNDLGNYRQTFEKLTNTKAARTGFLGLFADGEEVDIRMTREPQQHPPGY